MRRLLSVQIKSKIPIIMPFFFIVNNSNPREKQRLLEFKITNDNNLYNNSFSTYLLILKQ